MSRPPALRRLLGLAAAAAAWAPLAFASVTRIWVSDSATDFSSGEARGVAVTVDGTLVLARDSKRVEGVSEAAIYAGARGKDGSVFLATGEAGKILRVSPRGEVSTYATLPEKEVTALATGSDGAVYAATAPGAKVYRIDRAGEFSVYYEPKAQYVWALALSGGSLYVATGLPGEIHRVSSARHGERLETTADAHVRSLYVDKEGRVWAGTSGRGLVLRLDKGGKLHTLYDSSKTEITSIAAGADGRVWIAAGSAEVGAGGNEPISTPATGPAAKATQTEPTKTDEEARDKPEVTVSVSSPRLAPPRPGTKQSGYSSEVVLFQEGEAPRTVWTSSDELVFSLESDNQNGGVLAATGPNGKLYRIDAGRYSLERTFDEKQVTVLAGDAVATNSASSVYRLTEGPREGEYVSAVKDTGRTSRFGAFRWEGDVPSGSRVAFSFRSGESSAPDTTWSSWSPFVPASQVTTVDAPPGRYLQWKARMSSEGERVPVVRRVEAAYRNRNAIPVIESLTALGPAEVLARSASGGSNVFEATSPDEKGIFTGLEESKPEGSPRRLLRKGYRTLTWKASDPDGDVLTYDLEFRPADSQHWFTLRKELKENFYSFDTTALPDGEYVFRLTASDAQSNPGEGRSAQRETSPTRIDNTPPAIRKTSAASGVFEFEVTDAASPIQEVEYSVDAKEWIKAEPKDGLSDSLRESYVLRLDPGLKGGFLLIRATDASRNSAAASFVIP
ncbi:MAG TPA: two-component regulator propeller domain-containing protein [Thermoanaerobaculia bacterium]|nr:two-component regulator propeller domain-containing protein [Thermoanaerobaculia bacterium]